MARRSPATRHLAIRLAAASALALVLTACKDDQSARIDAPEPAPLSELAVIDDLPAAQPAPIGDYGPSRGYRLAERAYGLQQAVYDVPPDYGFAYDDEESYVWETADDWTMYAEPWDDGYRYYYYEPGAAYPYFVRDRNYGYGYDRGGVLVVVFDAGGRYLSRDLAYRMAPTAGRYYARGHELWSARRGAPRVAVSERTWAADAPRLVRTAEPWLRAGREQRDWRDWRARDNQRELRRFEGEQRQRQASAEVWRARLAQDRVETRAGLREDRRAAQADRGQLREDLQRQMQFERRDAQLQGRAERQREAQAERQVAPQPRRAADEVRARDDERRRQAFEQGRRQQDQARAEHARAEQDQRQQADRRQQQMAAREQARAQHEQQAQARAQANRAQAERAQHEQQAQAERQARQQSQRAEHEARAQAQQQQAQQQQAQQQARQQPAQQAREQARGADQNGRAAAGREGGKPDRQHPGKGHKD